MNGRFGVAALGPVVCGVSLAFAAPAPPKSPATPPAASLGAATESRLATQAALAELRAGGTAADAAVVAALVAGVSSPSSSGLGGGGFALVYDAASRTSSVLDFRETAPSGIDVSAFERRPLPDAERGKLVGVPGEAAGLFELSRRFGKRTWRELCAPAERWARQGVAVEPHLGGLLAGSDARSYRRDAGLTSVYFPGGKPALVGQRVTNPKLARTLARLRNEGPRAIYEGAIAKDIVASARSLGGAITEGDLTDYRVRERVPLVVRWDAFEVVTMPPPSAGGLLLAEVLGLFKKSELEQAGLEKPLATHLLAEAMRGAVADRSCCIGDPDFTRVELGELLAPERLAQRKKLIATDRTHLVKRFLESQGGTHHLVVADAAGNVVSLSTTVNSSFGADITAEASGIVLNDQLDDFTANADAAKLGVKLNPNAARPGARPVSSMMPTIVLRDGRPVLALGGSGGTAIPSNVTQVLLASLLRGMAPDAAVKAPRFRLASRDATILLDDGFSDAYRADLRWRGEIVKPNTSTSSAVQLLDWQEGRLRGAADPRKHGVSEVR
jgi:gamma-glutamyltranspeptidase/glutathione hydrolase